MPEKFDKRRAKIPENEEFYIYHYKKLGKTQNQIAKELRCGRGAVRNRVIKFGILRQRFDKLKGINKGEKNGQWKGNNVGLECLHKWIRRNKPKIDICQSCQIKPSFDLANISQKYKRDINDFKWMCRSCHMKYDYSIGVRNQ